MNTNKEKIITINKSSTKTIHIVESCGNISQEEFHTVSGLNLRLNAINFKHDPSDPKNSAVHFRNKNGVISGLEYSHDNVSSVKPALYILGEVETLKIRLFFFVKENIGEKDSYDLNLRINHKFLVDGLAHKISIGGSKGVVYAIDVDIPKSCINIKDRALTKYCGMLTIELSGDDSNFIKVFQKHVELYFLASRPTGKISIVEGKEENYPILEMIDLLMNGSDVEDYTKLSDKLYENNQLSFDCNSTAYLTRQTELQDGYRASYTNIDMEKFIQDINSGKTLSVASEVYAAVLLYGFWLCSQVANVFFARAVYPNFDINNIAHSMVFESHLLTAGMRHASIGNAKVRYHAAVMDPGKVFDGSVRLKKSIINPNISQPNNVPWGDYKQYLFSNNKEIFDGIIQDGYCHTFNNKEAFFIIQQSQDQFI